MEGWERHERVVGYLKTHILYTYIHVCICVCVYIYETIGINPLLHVMSTDKKSDNKRQEHAPRSSWKDHSLMTSLGSFTTALLARQLFRKGNAPIARPQNLMYEVKRQRKHHIAHVEGELGIRLVEVACCAEDHPSREGYFLLAKQGAFSFLLYLFLERVSSNIELLILLNCRGYRHALSHLVYMFTSVLVTKPKAVVMVGINCTNWATFPSLSKAIL